MFAKGLEYKSAEANGVIVGLLAQVEIFAPMQMIVDGGWLVYQRIAVCDDLEEHGNILRAAYRTNAA